MIFARYAPWRAERGRVVPGRRRRVRIAAVAQGPEVLELRRRYAERIRHAVKPFAGAVAPCGPTGSMARLRTQGEPENKSCREREGVGGLGSPATHPERRDTLKYG